MRDELDDFLCKKYPKIFSDRNKSMIETCMCWGFEVGDGWFNIIDQLCANIQSQIDWTCKDQVVATQVKEKFGTLRFYYNGGDEYISGLVSMAEAISAVTCETCGKPGKLRGKHWLYTACDEHSKKEDL